MQEISKIKQSYNQAEKDVEEILLCILTGSKSEVKTINSQALPALKLNFVKGVYPFDYIAKKDESIIAISGMCSFPLSHYLTLPQQIALVEDIYSSMGIGTLVKTMLTGCYLRYKENYSDETEPKNILHSASKSVSLALRGLHDDIIRLLVIEFSKEIEESQNF